MKVVPAPTSLATSMRPRCSSTMLREMYSPSPVPLPSSLVEKNGSKIFSMTGGAIPAPWSVIRTVTPVPAGISPTAARDHPPPPRGSGGTATPGPNVLTSSPPPSGIACVALTIRLRKTCLSFSPSPQTAGAAGSSSGCTLTLPFLSSYSTSPRVSSSTRLTSVAFISGFCGRANERMFCERRRMRCDSFWMMSAYLRVFSGRSFVATMMSLIIMIEVSGFLISCTIPEPIRPISASFSDRTSASIIRFFSVRSSEIADVPTTLPAESRITEKAISTGIARPSFAVRMTSKLFGSPPEARSARADSTGPRAPSVSRKLQLRPSASSLLQP